MLPDLPLDSVSWERRKDTFTSQLPLLAGLPGNVVLMEDSAQLCAGQGVMLWWPRLYWCCYTMWKAWPLQEGQGNLENSDGWRREWWEKYGKNWEYFSQRRGLEKQATPIVAGLEDFYLFLGLCLLLWEMKQINSSIHAAAFSPKFCDPGNNFHMYERYLCTRWWLCFWLHCNKRRKQETWGEIFWPWEVLQQ